MDVGIIIVNCPTKMYDNPSKYHYRGCSTNSTRSTCGMWKEKWRFSSQFWMVGGYSTSSTFHIPNVEHPLFLILYKNINMLQKHLRLLPNNKLIYLFVKFYCGVVEMLIFVPNFVAKLLLLFMSTPVKKTRE